MKNEEWISKLLLIHNISLKINLLKLYFSKKFTYDFKRPLFGNKVIKFSSLAFGLVFVKVQDGKYTICEMYMQLFHGWVVITNLTHQMKNKIPQLNKYCFVLKNDFRACLNVTCKASRIRYRHSAFHHEAHQWLTMKMPK